ncbi:MAG: hypothetical protein E7467_05990 [Ruminococcaceae bacterium]|nr:hypothetical protein [Oscillospiraceae bacterium]
MKRMRRILSLLLTICLLAQCYITTTSATEEYVFPDDWSREPLMFAVENGILAGDENRDLRPSDNMTRAEMAAVLVRILGAKETVDLTSYTDVDPNGWYYSELSSAVACGIFSGVSAKSMQPNHPITREQAVVVLCRAFGIVTDDRTAYQSFSDQRSISAYARDAVSAMKAQGMMQGYDDGTFRPLRLISRAEVAKLLYCAFDCIADTPEEIAASGTVIYRGEAPVPTELNLEGTLILGQGCGSFSIGSWIIQEGLVLRNRKDSLIDLRGLNTPQVVCAPTSAAVTLGEVEKLYLWGNGCVIDGTATKLDVLGGSHVFNGDCASVLLRSGKLTLNGNVSDAQLEASTTLEMNGEAECITILGEYANLSGSGMVKKIVSYPKNKTITVAYDELEDIWWQRYWEEYEGALEVVQTQVIPSTVLKRATMYADKAMTTQIRILEVGTKVFFEYHPDERIQVSLEDGTIGWIMRFVCSDTTDLVTTDGTMDYTQIVKEGFVNLNGYDSSTDYLIWVSRYTQKVIVFKGEKENWKLLHTFPCSTGKNETPTPAGVFEIFKHTKQWNFSDHCVRQVSSFNGGHAFHTVLLNYDGTYYNGRVGIPLSHGCVRLPIDNADYIYRYIPLGTRVVVY